MTRLYYIIHDPMNIIRVSYQISLLNVIMLCLTKSTIVTIKILFTRSYNQFPNYESKYFSSYMANSKNLLQVILFEIDCAIFYTNLHELFCQFISWTNWVNSGKFIDNCWILRQVMKKVYHDLIIINLYKSLWFVLLLFLSQKWSQILDYFKDF